MQKSKTLSLDEILELKKLLKEHGASNIHLHDTCGGQYFSLDNPDTKTIKIISDYLSSKNLRAAYDITGLGFSVLPAGGTEDTSGGAF